MKVIGLMILFFTLSCGNGDKSKLNVELRKTLTEVGMKHPEKYDKIIIVSASQSCHYCNEQSLNFFNENYEEDISLVFIDVSKKKLSLLLSKEAYENGHIYLDKRSSFYKLDDAEYPAIIDLSNDYQIITSLNPNNIFDMLD